jgi:hypothetical protein
MNNIETLGIRDVQAREPYTEVSVSYRGRRYVIRAVYTYKFNPSTLSAKLWSVHNGTMTRTYYRTLDSNLDFNEAITQKVFYEDMLNLIKEIDYLSGLREYDKSKDIPKTGVLITSILVTTDFYRSLKYNSYQPTAKGANPLIDLQIDSIMGIQVYIDDDYCKKHNTEVVYITKPILSKEEFKAIIARLDNLISK